METAIEQEKLNPFQAALKKLEPKPYLKKDEYDYVKRSLIVMHIAQAMVPGFEITEEEKKIYHNAVMYFAGDTGCEWDLRKGLYVCGKIGVGKTTFFRIMAKSMQFCQSGNSFRKFNSTDLVDGFQKKGFEYFENLGAITSYAGGGCRLVPSHILLDDLGQSSNVAKYFGSSTNIVSEFIQRRYILFTDENVLTHISTNIEPSEIRNEYGEFVASRMREMFNVIIYPGSDRRK